MAAVEAAQPWLPTDCETMEYRNPQGGVVRFLMLVGTTGRMMPPVQVATLPVPQANGSRFLGAAHLESIVAMPVAFPGTLTDRAELRRWANVLDPLKGEGTLTVIGGPSGGRQLRCCYDAGLDALEEIRPDVNLGTLLFRAARPYWQDSIEQSVTVSQGSAVRKWFPFLPLILGASDAYGLLTITNHGDVPTWPIFTAVGPGTDVTAENLTTGESWQVTGALAAGATLVVDTTPGVKTARIDGVNVFNRLAPGSELWALQPGPNQVQLSIALTSAASRVTIAWRDLWLSA